MLAWLVFLLPATWAAPTVHCIALVTPNTYEADLLAGQWRLQAGIFKCDTFAVYSNVSGWALLKDHKDVLKSLAPLVRNLHRSLWAPMVAGPPGTSATSPQEIGKAGAKHLANAEIFESLWSSVCSEKSYENQSYTAKVDIDTVLLPERLKGFLLHRPGRAEFFYNTRADTRLNRLKTCLKTCLFVSFLVLTVLTQDMYGNLLHGPLELLSVEAMKALCARGEKCTSISKMAYGEDFFLNECLKLLSVPGVPSVKDVDLDLLYDMYSYGDWAQKRCDALIPDKTVSTKKQYFVSYHPYKTMSDWIACHQQTGVSVFSPAQINGAQQEALRGATGSFEIGDLELAELPMNSKWLLGICLVALVAGALVFQHRLRSRRSLVMAPLVAE